MILYAGYFNAMRCICRNFVQWSWRLQRTAAADLHYRPTYYKNNHQTAPAFVSATYSEERTEVKSERGRYAQPSILLQNTGKNVSRLNISYVCNVVADDGPAYDRDNVRAKSLAFLDNV